MSRVQDLKDSYEYYKEQFLNCYPEKEPTSLKDYIIELYSFIDKEMEEEVKEFIKDQSPSYHIEESKKVMTLVEVKERLKKIEEVSYDNEDAHSRADSLMEDFIKFVSESEEYPELKEMAKEILKVYDMNFTWWYA
jgi:hypothetical protein